MIYVLEYCKALAIPFNYAEAMHGRASTVHSLFAQHVTIGPAPHRTPGLSLPPELITLHYMPYAPRATASWQMIFATEHEE